MSRNVILGTGSMVHGTGDVHGSFKKIVFHWLYSYMRFLVQFFLHEVFRYFPLFMNAGSDTTSSQKAEVYNVPEYFSYNEFSYYDIDNEMANHRMKQPEPRMKN